MNIFTVNQVTHAYVANALKTSTNEPAEAGDIKVASTPEGELYFKYFGKGGLTRSDLIDVKNLLWYSATPASKMEQKLKVAVVTLADAALDNGAPVAGQDYVLRIEFDGYIGISPEDSKYWKHAVTHVGTNTAAKTFYANLAISLAKSLSREAVDLIKVYVTTNKTTLTSGNLTEVTKNTKLTDLTGTYVGIVIKEVEQDWIRGTKQQKRLKFKVIPTEITVKEGNFYNDVCWGDVTDATATYGEVIKNGKLAADYEYFFMGERGDQYRMVGFPDYVPTDYMITDTTKEYDFINLHYAYVGANECVQKSEKDIVIMAPRAAGDTTATSLGTLAASIKSAIDTEIAKYQPMSAADTTAAIAEATE